MTLPSGGLVVLRFGPTLPCVPAALSVWQLPQFFLNAALFAAVSAGLALVAAPPPVARTSAVAARQAAVTSVMMIRRALIIAATTASGGGAT